MIKLVRGDTSISFTVDGDAYILCVDFKNRIKNRSEDLIESYFNTDCYFCKVKLIDERNGFLKLGNEIADFVTERFCDKCWEKIKKMDDRKILSMVALKKMKGQI